MAPSDLTDLAITQSRASHGFTLREQAARGGATSPQGTDVDRTWVDISRRRGRRSPLVSRSRGRPRPTEEQARFRCRNCWWQGTAWGVWGGTSAELDVVPSMSPLANRVSMRATKKPSRNGAEPNRRRTIGHGRGAVTLLSRTVCRRGVSQRFSSGSSAQSKNCIRATESTCTTSRER
jgi:hypothetical protein